MNLINVNNLSKSFRRGERDFFAIDNVSFDVNEKDFINIIGKSGSGKTTLLTLLSAIIEPTSGDIFVEGKNLSKMDDEEKSGYRNEFIGYVPQSLGTLPTLNVLDNVRLPYFFKKREGNGIERARMLLDMCGILDLENDFCKNLSGGELKRVLIARALMNEPKILIADEPTSDLDSKTTIEIMNMLKEINEKGTTIITMIY